MNNFYWSHNQHTHYIVFRNQSIPGSLRATVRLVGAGTELETYTCTVRRRNGVEHSSMTINAWPLEYALARTGEKVAAIINKIEKDQQ